MNELSLYTLIENFPGHVYWKKYASISKGNPKKR